MSVKGSRGELVVSGSCKALMRFRAAALARLRAEVVGIRTDLCWEPGKGGSDAFGSRGGPDPDSIAAIVV